MKHFNKILALLLAAVLVLAMSATVFAAGDGSITVSNTTENASYVAYKVFDATYSGDNVAYTYDGSNAAFLAALQGQDSPFTVTQVLDSGVYTVVKKAGVSDEAILSFIKANGPVFDGDSNSWTGGNLGTGTSKTGNGESITFSNLDYGYYFITSSVGSLVTIDSALKDVTVVDKNQEITTPDKQESVDGGNNWSDQGDAEEANAPTASVGDTVNYKIVGTFTRYQGEDLVKALKFKDTMSSGLTADQNVVIKINGTTISAPDDYTVTYTQNNNETPDDTTDDYWVTEITIPTATVSGDGAVTYLYDANNTYEITYSAKIDEDAIIDGEEENTVDLDYVDQNNADQEVGSDTTTVKNYDLSLNKKDGKNTEDTADDSPLAGAAFELYAKDGTTPINVVLVSGSGEADSEQTNTYRLAEAGETEDVITEMVVGTTGTIVVKGLENGEYEFEETQAPAGYNKLTARTEVATITNASVSINVVNNSGSELPSTGGIGTTIFYVLGAVLVVGAAVLLIARKRMGNRN